MNLPLELKTRIDDHIRSVQKHLGDLPADEKREIIQSLENHIHDALEARACGTPTPDLLETILAELDPPESYGPDPSLFSPENSRSLSPRVKIGFFILMGALAFLFAFLWINDPFSSHWMESETAENIQMGVGWNGLSIGMTNDDLVENLGAPQPNHPAWLMRWNAYPYVDVVITDEGLCREVRFNQGFKGTTIEGIQLGSSYEEMILAYGTPELIWTRNACVIAEWPSKGIAFWTLDSEVTQIIVRKPGIPSQPPFKNEPAVLGHWRSIDFVREINTFDPANRSWAGELVLKELTFLPNGATSNRWKWTQGRILHKNTQGRYELKQIGNTTYLFIEWMSGDVTERGIRPSYYVFKKD